MSSPIISVENLGKSYLVGHQSSRQESYTALRDVIGRHAKSFVCKGLDMARGRQIVQGDEVEEFWALKDINFEINEGEVVGIIGRNGAGKSTLLKILSRITEPTKGKVTLRGRVASLLEVGTGFHPELTGRENIFLNGAILGMTRVEIKKKFDEIADFAGVEQFLDTPVKRYSSGMYVRLAFAVAAHLEPEILIVDEVLAVGDAKFQAKCIGKMRDIAKREGRTILFVTHDLRNAVRLCTKGMLMLDGSNSQLMPINKVVDKYLSLDQTVFLGEREFSEELTVISLDVSPNSITCDTPFKLVAKLRVKKSCIARDLHFYISTPSGDRVSLLDCRSENRLLEFKSGSIVTVEASAERSSLVSGHYFAGLCVRTDDCFDAIEHLAEICVAENESTLVQYDRQYLGALSMSYSSSVTSSSDVESSLR
tara:strand:+ start:1333 stop:2604 length:1272 start_codon:yes stop_codon:yes gene_type:complete